MEIHFSKWGNSLALRIPKTVAEELNITEGSIADLRLTNDKSLVIKKVNHKKNSLDKLLNKISNENLHNELSSGYSLGAENID